MDHKMRVLFFAPNYYPHVGGVERHIRSLSREIAKDGHSVTILVLKDKDSYSDRDREGTIEVIRFSRPTSRTFASLQRKWQVLRLLDRFIKADVIHYHDFATMWRYGLFLYPLLKLMRKKIYLTFHGWEGHVPPRKKAVRRRKVLERLVDGNICVGHFIEKWYGTRADIVSYGGVEAATGAGSCGDYMVFVGRLAEDTGIRVYLEAWRKIHMDHEGMQLLICGDGVLRDELERYVLGSGMTGVRFLGFVGDPERYLKDARVVFTAGYLGILEAFAWKKPVVTVYDNALKKDYLEMMPNAQDMMWIASDSEAVARCIGEALNDQDKAQKGHAFAQAHSWKQVKDDYYRLWSGAKPHQVNLERNYDHRL